jgi:hypothetical protein
MKAVTEFVPVHKTRKLKLIKLEVNHIQACSKVSSRKEGKLCNKL